MKSAAIPSTHKECAECKFIRSRKTDYLLRKRSDPYGLATRENDRRKRKGAEPVRLVGKTQRPMYLSEEEFKALAEAEPPVGKPLWVQMVCKRCEGNRSSRRTRFNALKREYDVKHEDSRFRTYSATKPLPPEVVEQAAVNGMVLVDTLTNKVVMPADPVAALRVCFGSLTSKLRHGTLGPDRLQHLALVAELVVKQEPSKLTERAEDVRDVALVRGGGKGANEAMERLLTRYRHHHAKIAWGYVSNKLMDEEDAMARLDQGILLGIHKWDPLHKSQSRLPTVCHSWVRRSLQIRTRADRPLGVYELQGGGWSKAAISLDKLRGNDDQGASSEDGSYDPHATSYVSGGCTQGAFHSADAAADERNLQMDLARAMAALSPEDREIVQRIYVDNEQQKLVAADMGVSKGHLAKRLKLALAVLREALSPYDEEQEVQDEDEVSVDTPAADDTLKVALPEEPIQVTLARPKLAHTPAQFY